METCSQDLSGLVQGLVDNGIPGDGPVETLLQTHISWILLTSAFAYKIKKPVDLGFVDFSTREKRRFYCQEEVRLNRRQAAGIYLGVISFSGNSDHPAIAGDEDSGNEFAVKMKRFDATAELSEKMLAGEVTRQQIQQFAVDLAAFHAVAAVSEPSSDDASPTALRSRALDNFRAVREVADDTELCNRLRNLENWSKDSLRKLESAFYRRKNFGRIRECHGDLHLGNMVMIDDRIIAFDCLEFNADFRWIDVASDIAFLLMDLAAAQYHSARRVFLNTYLESSGDYALLPLLRHYMLYRAMVRAKVATVAAAQQQRLVQEDENVLQYIALAEAIAGNSKSGGIIILHGFSGCGKTWLSRQLVPRVDLIHLRSDILRQQLDPWYCDDRNDNVSDVSSARYSEDARANIYHQLLDITEQMVHAGYTVLVDATFISEARRSEFRQLAGQLSVPFGILDVTASVETLEARINARSKQGLDASEADVAVLHNQLRHADPITAAEQKVVIPFNADSDGDFLEVEQLAKSLTALASRAVPDSGKPSGVQ